MISKHSDVTDYASGKAHRIDGVSSSLLWTDIIDICRKLKSFGNDELNYSLIPADAFAVCLIMNPKDTPLNPRQPIRECHNAIKIAKSNNGTGIVPIKLKCRLRNVPVYVSI